MSGEAGVWTPGESGGGSTELPAATDLAREAFEDLTNNFVPFLMAGLGVMVVVTVGVMIGMFLILGVSFAGALAEDAMIMLAAMFVGYGAFFLVLMVILPPIYASLIRSVWAYLTQGEPLSFTSGFSSASQDIGPVYGVFFIATFLSLIGMMMCYLPGLIASMFLGFALPAVAVHRLGPMEAVRLSAGHVRDHLQWHAVLFLLGVAAMIVGSMIPFVGSLVATPWYYAYYLRAYRAAFGDGELPKGY